MYKNIIFSLATLSFLGCSSTTALKHFENEPTQASAIQDTKKADIIENDKIKALYWATYLNNIKEAKNDKFLISLYFTYENKEEYKKISKENFLLDEKEAISIKKIEREKFPFILENRPWGKHYIVSFQPQKEDFENINLSFTYNSHLLNLKFQK